MSYFNGAEGREVLLFRLQLVMQIVRRLPR